MQSRLAWLGVTIAVTLVTAVACWGEAWQAGWAILAIDGPVWLAWAGACYGWGRHIVGGKGPLAEVGGWGVGYGVLGTLTLLLGLAGLLGIGGWVLLIGGLGLAGWHVWPRRGAVRRWWGRPAGWLWGLTLAGGAWGVMLAGALVLPGLLWGDEPNGYDVASYHMQLPREWFDGGRIAATPHNVFGNFPLLVEMHYLLAMHVRGGPFAGMYVAKLTHLAAVVAAAGVVVAAVWPRSRTGAVAGGVLVAATPWAVLLGSVAYNEGGLMLFAAVAVAFAVRGEGWRDYAVAGLAVGFGCGCKYTGVPLLLVGVPVALIVGTWGGWGAWGLQSPRLRGAGIVFGVGVLAFAPWWVRNLIWTGNPVFPQLTGIFPVEGWDEVLRERWRAAHSAKADDSLVGALVGQVLSDWRYAWAVLPVGLIGGAIAAARRETRAAGLTTLTLLAGFVTFWLLATHLQSRFLAVAVPVAALGAGWAGTRWAPATGLAAVAALAVTLAYVPAKLAPYRPAVGMMNVEPLFAELHAGVRREVEYAAETGRPITLVGDAKAWFYPMPVRYHVVFNARGDDPLTAYDVRPGDLVIVEAGELGRLSRTYHELPAPEDNWRGEFVLNP